MKACSMLQIALEARTIWTFLMPLIKELEREGFVVETACRKGHFMSDIEEKGIVVNSIYCEHSLNPIKVFRSFLSILHLVKNKAYDVVVTHTSIVSFISRIAARVAGVPVIIYIAHGLPFGEGMASWKWNTFFLLEKTVGHFTDALICMNEDDYITAKRRKLISNTRNIFRIKGIGVDTTKYRPLNDRQINLIRSALNIANNEKVVGFIGRLIPEKGIMDFLMAAAYVRNVEKVKFIILGDGPLEKKVKKFCRDNDMENSVLFLGFHKKIENLAPVFDVFALPTYYLEGVPRSILEVMAMEKPVIATDVSGCRDAVLNGITGMLIPPRSPYILAENVLYLLRNPKLAKQMGKRGRMRVNNEFSQGVVYEELKRIHRKLITAKLLEAISK